MSSERAKSLIREFGRNAVNAIYPQEIEAYTLALELVEGSGDKKNTIDYFLWPVMPSAISTIETEVTNIKKSMGGVTALSTPTFVPKKIIISGTFGRSFKILIGGTNFLSFRGIKMSIDNGFFSKENLNSSFSVRPTVFNPSVKSGYGCMRVLKAIKDKSNALDVAGSNYSLYFYNPVQGDNYVVKFNRFKHDQNETDANMMPKYEMELTAIAPLEALFDFNKFSLVRNLAFSSIQGGANRALNRVKRKVFGG